MGGLRGLTTNKRRNLPVKHTRTWLHHHTASMPCTCHPQSWRVSVRHVLGTNLNTIVHHSGLAAWGQGLSITVVSIGVGRGSFLPNPVFSLCFGRPLPREANDQRYLLPVLRLDRSATAGDHCCSYFCCCWGIGASSLGRLQRRRGRLDCALA